MRAGRVGLHDAGKNTYFVELEVGDTVRIFYFYEIEQPD